MARRELSDDDWALVEPLLPIGGYGTYPHRLRDQFEGVVWRFRTGSQWREMPEEFGALVEALISEAARRGQVDLSLVSVDSTTARAHHDAAGARVSEDVLAALEEAVEQSKGAAGRNKRIKKVRKRLAWPTLSVPSGAGFTDGAARG